MLYFIVIIRAFYCLRSSVSLFSCWNVFPLLLFCFCCRVSIIIYFFICITLRFFLLQPLFYAISYSSRVYKRYFIESHTLKCSARCWLRCFIIIKENTDNNNQHRMYWRGGLHCIAYDWRAQSNKNHRN